MHHAGCSHLFCEECWQGFVGSSVNDGPMCLRLRCPDTSCNAAVGEDMINAFACEESRQKYSSYLLRSYIEDKKNTKWCPAPNCGFAINFIAGSDSSDVTCECINSFCWNCGLEAHRPVDCSTVEKWMLKNNSEAENVKWIIAYSKPCPRCKRPIEKNEGCNHMTCSMCGFYFCWLCLVALDGGHSCNSYKDKRANDNKSEEKREARKDIAKYSHYYERWEANNRSMDQAVRYLKNMQTPGKQEELVFILCLDGEENQEMQETLIKSIVNAWLQIIECRRLLKWSYTYGYYLPEHEPTKIQFFELVQGVAETALEELHRFAEEELQTCLDSEAPFRNFATFQKTLVERTTATGDRFEDLVSAFKNGLSEVLCAGSSTQEIATWDYGSKVQGHEFDMWPFDGYEEYPSSDEDYS